MLGLETVEPGAGLRSHQVRLGLLGKCQEVFGMATLEGGQLTAGLQLLKGVLPDRLQHREARLALGGLLRAEEALFDQRAHAIEDVGFRILGVGEGRVVHSFPSTEGESADEDRQATEQSLLGLGQEVVAPGDRGAERLLTDGNVPGATGQKLEAMLQPSAQRLRSQVAGSCCRQLERQGQAVEAPADLGHGRSVQGIEPKSRLRAPGAVHEEPTRL